MSGLFVIPSKHDPTRPLAAECADRVRAHHPAADILIVENKHYTQGAYAMAPTGYDHYYLIQDSLMLNAPIPAPDPLITVRWFGDPPHPWGWDANGNDLRGWGAAQLAKLGIGCPDRYRGVFGPMWACTGEVMDALTGIGFWSILPVDKYEQCALERVTGIVLAHLGYDVRVSLQGEHHGHFDAYDETVVTKLDMARM